MVEPSVQQVVCLTRACREIREFPSVITLLPRSTEIGGKNKDYLPEGLDCTCMYFDCLVTLWKKRNSWRTAKD